MNRLERLDFQFNLERKKLDRLTLGQNIDKLAARWGLQGLWGTGLVIVLVFYLAMSAVFLVLGVRDIYASLIALPASAGLGFTLMRLSRQRDETRFRKQLLQAFGIIAAQIEAGDSINRAIDKTILLVEDPLRRELKEAVSKMVGTTSLTQVLGDLAEKYPSRAINLFIAALEIDEKMGAKLAPTLRQAQQSLERHFDLVSEATAEVSQARVEFLGITAVIAMIALGMLFAADNGTRGVYTSSTGLLLLGLTLANYMLGVVRTLRIFSKANRGGQ